MNRRWLPYIGVLCLLLGGAFAWQKRKAPDRPLFVTTPVERGRLVARVTATGTLSALVTVQVGSQVSGRISQLFADFNSQVKKGQVIARIDPQLFWAAVEQAHANSVAAEGNLARVKAQALDAKRQLERSRVLRQQNLVAQADLDTAEANEAAAVAQVSASEGAVKQARAALHQAEINLKYTTIVSPIDGVVISRSVDVGQTVAASLQAPTLFTIAEDLKKMQVDTNVAEADVGKLRPGMAATFTVDAYPVVRFRGTVRQIRNSPQTVQNVVTYDAVIDVGNAELKLKPGMTANVTFIYAERDDSLRVSNTALRYRPSMEKEHNTKQHGGFAKKEGHAPDERTVWVLKDGKPMPVKVKLGVSDGSNTEVVEGALQEGDLLITESEEPKERRAMGSPIGGAPMMRRGH
jgi:HlyD family secretion protein